ncbi:hypothetical protein KIS4809_2934 [Bacillus sp. ZZV12-4809]|nr:hypothetical protein KIS4809_2934 [Bacillus sp. ZZV12-4809]
MTIQDLYYRLADINMMRQKVPGVERDDMDEGHIIADSMGGVSNAYNITPQESTLNRHGDQAYLEDSIRKAGGATDFEAIITYPDTETQIPSHYQYTYTLRGNKIVDAFDNVNPPTFQLLVVSVFRIYIIDISFRILL